jgi:hypothetical protein
MTCPQLTIRNDGANPVRHCEAHMEILKIKKNSACRGNLTNWNKMPHPVRHCEEFRVPMAIGIAEKSVAIF